MNSEELLKVVRVLETLSLVEMVPLLNMNFLVIRSDVLMWDAILRKIGAYPRFTKNEVEDINSKIQEEKINVSSAVNHFKLKLLAVLAEWGEQELQEL